LLCAARSRAHVELGYGSFAEYVERLFGYDARWTKEKLRVAEALEELPELARALSGGELSWSAVRELTRVATAETETEWLEAARGRTVRELERQVSGRKPGDRPGDAARESAMRHVLRFEISADTLAIMREAMAKLRRDSDLALDDDAALLLMARHVLGGPNDEGRASYQVLLNVCEHCGRGQVQARGERVDVGPEVVAMARCDAQWVRTGDGEADRGTCVEPSSEDDRELGFCGRPERVSQTHVGHEGGDRAEHESDTHVGHHGNAGAEVPHAAQDIPPAVRRWVMRRDRGRCVVPGCRNAIFVDVHHITPRSEGGGHDPDGLITACAAHHRAAHRGQLTIQGRVSTGLTFRHADGRLYGEPVCPRAADVWAKAFRALRGMGFSERETRRALEKTRNPSGEERGGASAGMGAGAEVVGGPPAGRDVGTHEVPGIEHVLRRALAVLTETPDASRPARSSGFASGPE
jgi:hypothetical protein